MAKFEMTNDQLQILVFFSVSSVPPWLIRLFIDNEDN
jgi:hypothetical protein